MRGSGLRSMGEEVAVRANNQHVTWWVDVKCESFILTLKNQVKKKQTKNVTQPPVPLRMVVSLVVM